MTSPITTAPGDITVRPSRPCDGEFVAQMLVEGFRDKVIWAVGESSIPAVKEYIAAIQQDPSRLVHRILIAEYRGRPAGLAKIGVKDDPWSCYSALMDMDGIITEKTCYLHQISVDEKCRGLGIGKVLLEHIEQEGRAMGCQRMMLHVAKENRARSLYERQGYEMEALDDGYCIAWCALGVRVPPKISGVARTMASPVTKAPGDITVRHSRPDDGKFVAQMFVEGFYDKVTWAVGESSIPAVKEYIAAIQQDPSCLVHRILIAEYRGRPAGLAKIGCKDDPWSCYSALMNLDGWIPEKTCYLQQISVDEKYRGLGIGKVLLDHIEQEGRVMGCQRMMLHVAKENWARKLYERQGYEMEALDDGYCIAWCALGVRSFYKMVKAL